MSILQDIRNQSPHIREIFMWLCVVITFSVVSFFWVKAESRQIVALLNPQAQTGPVYAENSKNENSSLFGNIGKSAGNLKANLFDLLGLNKKTDVPQPNSANPQASQNVEPQLFPTSKDK